MSYVYVACTVLLTVYGQLVIKWQVLAAGAFPETAGEKMLFLARLLINPWIVSALAAALAASMTWMAAMTRLDLSHAYPFLSAVFIFVPLASVLLFNEPVTSPKVVGLVLIVAGIVIGSQG
ncbi:MAG: EamA family transporter [Betaproteobacteria bacterium]|nr:EamA family transporter [Betaproteobacteria bacterium]